MKLNREERAKLFAGEPISITFPATEPCPYPVGHIEVLSANVRLEVTEIRRTKPSAKDPEGRHSLGYTLHNQRLGDRYLAKQAGQAHPEQYVSSPSGGIDLEAGAAVDELTQLRITREARAKEREETAELVAAAEEVAAKLKERSDQDPSRKRVDWPLRREIDRLVQREKRKAA